MTLPITYAVEVAWTTDLTGLIRLGYSTVSGADVFGGAFSGASFDDVTDHVYGFSTNRGRSDDLGEIDQGTATIKLRDHDGRFNPENASSDLYGYLLPLRPVRIQATHNGTTYGVFRGFIDRIEFDPLTRESVIECVDLFEFLSSDIESLTVAATTAGAAIGEILDELEFTDPALRSLDAGHTITPPGTAATGTYLERVGDSSVADRGVFFMTKDGIARYISGANYWAKTATTATLDGDGASTMRVGIDKQRIVNRVTVTMATVPYVATNAASRALYGFRNGSAIDLAYGLTPGEAQAMARWIVAIQGDPGVPARSIALKPGSDARAVVMLGLEIGDRVAFSEPRGSTNGEGKVEGIAHTVEVGALHVATVLVSKRTRDAFTVDRSTVGGVDLVYW